MLSGLDLSVAQLSNEPTFDVLAFTVPDITPTDVVTLIATADVAPLVLPGQGIPHNLFLQWHSTQLRNTAAGARSFRRTVSTTAVVSMTVLCDQTISCSGNGGCATVQSTAPGQCVCAPGWTGP